MQIQTEGDAIVCLTAELWASDELRLFSSPKVSHQESLTWQAVHVRMKCGSGRLLMQPMGALLTCLLSQRISQGLSSRGCRPSPLTCSETQTNMASYFRSLGIWAKAVFPGLQISKRPPSTHVSFFMVRCVRYNTLSSILNEISWWTPGHWCSKSFTAMEGSWIFVGLTFHRSVYHFPSSPFCSSGPFSMTSWIEVDQRNILRGNQRDSSPSDHILTIIWVERVNTAWTGS